MTWVTNESSASIWSQLARAGDILKNTIDLLSKHESYANVKMLVSRLSQAFTLLMVISQRSYHRNTYYRCKLQHIQG